MNTKPEPDFLHGNEFAASVMQTEPQLSGVSTLKADEFVVTAVVAPLGNRDFLAGLANNPALRGQRFYLLQHRDAASIDGTRRHVDF